MKSKNTEAPVLRAEDYRGLHAVIAPEPVDDARVEKELDSLRLRAAVWRPAGDGAVRGDRVTISFAGFTPQGEPIPESRAERAAVLLGGGGLLASAEAALYGRHGGERFELPLCYPADFRVRTLAGQPAVFRIAVHTVERRMLPAADDAFARAQGCADLAALREKLRAQIARRRAALARESAKDALLAQAGAKITAPLPVELLEQLEQKVQTRLAAQEGALRQAGETPAAFYARSGHPRAWHEARARAAEERLLRAQQAVQAIARAEKISVGEAEIAAEQARLAAKAGAARAVPGADALRQALLQKKVREYLLAQADVGAARGKQEKTTASRG